MHCTNSGGREFVFSMKHLNYDYKALFTQKVALVLSKMVILSYFRYSPTSIIPQPLNINLHILRTVFCTFPKVPTGRNCLTVKSFFSG